MVVRIMQRLSYANVVATLALFVALGGSSYAAVQLSKNSVRSKHVKNGQIKGADLAKNAVTTAKVKDGTLLAGDFKAGQLRAGPAGAAGPAGPAGPSGAPGPTGPAGADGAPGTARAYGRIVPAACASTPSQAAPQVCTPDRHRNLSVVRPTEQDYDGFYQPLGRYCIAVPGVDSRQTPAVVSVDSDGSTHPGPLFGLAAMRHVPDAKARGCPGSGDFVVETSTSYLIPVRNSSDNGTTQVVGGDYTSTQVAFTVIVP